MLRKLSRSASRLAASAASARRARSTRNSDLARERLQQVALLREQHAALIARQHGQHAEPLPQRQIQARRGRKRVGAQAGPLAVIDNPLSDSQIGMPKGNGQARIAWILEFARRSPGAESRPCTGTPPRRDSPPPGRDSTIRASLPARDSWHRAVPSAVRAHPPRAFAGGCWP